MTELSNRYITASMLYDLVMCEHRPWMDLHADPALRDEASPFVQMLWKRGRAHENEVLASRDKESVNLRTASSAERERLTLEAMKRGVPFIYGGLISSDDLWGEPDILRLGPSGRYEPGDIKSGAAEEGPANAERKPKIHYAVQLALYVDVLERLGFSESRRAFIWDIHGEEVYYDLELPKGAKTPSTLWDDYAKHLATARQIATKTRQTTPAYSAECKQCWWNTTCLGQLEELDDLTLIPELGRARRDAMLPYVTTIAGFAAAPPETFIDAKGKSVLHGIGPETISKYRARAVLSAKGGSAYLKRPIALPDDAIELFFDIETDPMHDHCYLHGFIERRDRDDASERYYSFFTPSINRNTERQTFVDALNFVRSRWPCAIYIYSKYERTWWRALCEKYPDVCDGPEIDALFANSRVVDLYEIIQSSTEWPTRDYSLKTLAKHLGFGWRDAHPSGAASIEWFDRYLGGEAAAKDRILDYNEDDCRSMRVLLDGLRGLPVLDRV